MVTGGSPKINTLAFRRLQPDNKVLFKPRKIIERTILYKMKRPRALYDGFWSNYIKFTKGPNWTFFKSFPPNGHSSDQTTLHKRETACPICPYYWHIGDATTLFQWLFH